MAHIRKTIREQVVTTVTGLTTTASRVYETRIHNLSSADLPALVVYTNDEAVEYVAIGSSARTQERVLSVTIEAHVKGTANIDDTIDTISEEVEEAMAGDITRGGHARNTELKTMEIEFDTASQKVGLARFNYDITYLTVENAVQTGV